ncbi:low-affinity Zn(2+) transporter zrt2, partial [Coemansia sp. RSA 1836]
FFEGLALGTSLAELYWIKAQIAAQFRASEELHAIDSESLLAMPSERCHKISLSSSAAAAAMNTSSSYHVVNVNVVGSTTFSSNAEFSPTAKKQSQQAGRRRSAAQMTDDDDLCSADFEYCSPDRNNNNNRRSKSRRTLASMATSFTPEPWQVNPQLEKTLGAAGTAIAASATAAPGAPTHSVANKKQPAATANKHGLALEQQRRYLRPRSAPERLPGWWKAWLSALAFTMTTPTGIIIGLAVRHVYEPQSSYALLFNGVLQSICTGVLVYAGLVTLMVGGFGSAQVKRLPRLRQVLLFFAVYAGAAVMASLKIWK